MQVFFVILCVSFLIGCSTVKTTMRNSHIVEAPAIQQSPMAKLLRSLPELDGSIMTVAVYTFQDKTGQRKSADNFAQFSSAVTQGAESWLIDSLQTAGNSKWFKVLERTSLDDLIKERQMYRQAEVEFSQDKNSGLKPMLFAGLIAQGGVIAYDSDVQTGGIGANIMGLGASEKWRKDVITVSLRFVSTNTGEILISVAATKTVFSCNLSGSALTFVSDGTKYSEAELGMASNEPVNLALRAAIDAAVIETIKQGQIKGYWKFKTYSEETSKTK